MGTFTPNIGLYIPAAGETNFNDSFASGMINLDQHDHSGGPNKGVLITTTALANLSVTYNKLNSNVADTTTGIGVNSTPPYQNQLQLLGVVKNLFTLGDTSGVGMLSINGETIVGRSFVSNDGSITWTNANGVSGNPNAQVNTGAFLPVTVANGGTSVTSFNPYDIICGGTGDTTALQQVSGEGTTGQFLGSNGTGMLPSWQNLPTPAAQNLLIATLIMSTDTFTGLTNDPSKVNEQIIPSPGAGNAVVIYSAYAKLNQSGAAFTGGSAITLYYGTNNTTNFAFSSSAFKAGSSGYYYANNNNSASSTVIPTSQMAGQAINVGVNSTAYAQGVGGTSSTVSISVQYSIITI